MFSCNFYPSLIYIIQILCAFDHVVSSSLCFIQNSGMALSQQEEEYLLVVGYL